MKKVPATVKLQFPKDVAILISDALEAGSEVVLEAWGCDVHIQNDINQGHGRIFGYINDTSGG